MSNLLTGAIDRCPERDGGYSPMNKLPNKLDAISHSRQVLTFRIPRFQHRSVKNLSTRDKG